MHNNAEFDEVSIGVTTYIHVMMYIYVYINNHFHRIDYYG